MKAFFIYAWRYFWMRRTLCHYDTINKASRDLRVILTILFDRVTNYSFSRAGYAQIFSAYLGSGEYTKINVEGGSLGDGSRPPTLKCRIRLELEIRLYSEIFALLPRGFPYIYMYVYARWSIPLAHHRSVRNRSVSHRISRLRYLALRWDTRVHVMTR